MSPGYLSRLESGDRPPTPKIIDYLAKQLGVHPSALATATPTGLAAALAVATSALAVATSSGPESAVAERVRRALAADPAADHSVRWQAHWLLARRHAEQGQREEELEQLTALLRLSAEIGEPQLQVRAYNQLALCHRGRGDIQAALAAAERARELAGENNVPDRARAMLTIVSALAELGWLTEAGATANELVRLVADQPGTLSVEALWAASTVRMRQGQPAAAAELMETALQRLASQDDLTLWVRLRLAAASLLLQLKQPDGASFWLDQAQLALDLVGTPLHRQEYQLLRAELAFDRGDLVTVRTLVNELVAGRHQLTFRDYVRLELLRGHLNLRDGQRERALTALRDIAAAAQEQGQIDLVAQIWRTVAEILAETE
jgi:tetratricopeptide (TPR) repeat protein